MKIGLISKDHVPEGTKFEEWAAICNDFELVIPEQKSFLGPLEKSVPFDEANDIEGWFRSGEDLFEDVDIYFWYHGKNPEYKKNFPEPKY